MIKYLIPVVFVLFSINAHATDPVYSSWGKAIRGYDPVAYFIESKPVKGNKSFIYEWNGATWYFSSQANLDMFKTKPAQYAPQYGGYCAWAVSRGYTAKIDPEAWAIVDGKLYLNYNADIQAQWSEDTVANIALADSLWPDIVNK